VPDTPATEEVLGHTPTAQESSEAPPTYGDHQFDRPVDPVRAAASGSTRGTSALEDLYEGIDPAGFLTPGNPTNSGPNTPLYAHSRSNSDENVGSIDAVAQDTSDEGLSSIDLHSRLARIQEHGSSHWARQQGHSSHHTSHHTSGLVTPNDAARRPLSGTDHDIINPYFPSTRSSGRQSAASSAPHSRRPSNEINAAPSSPLGPIHMEDYDMEALSRLPSYTTALRTPARTPGTQEPPTYEVATSRPPSPQDETVPVLASSSTSSPSIPQRPLPNRAGSGHRSGQRSGSESSGSDHGLSETTARNTQLNATRLH